MTIEQELQALDEQQRVLDEQRDALRNQRAELKRRQQEALIAAAGDVKAGDLVIIRSNYGDAKKGALHLVTKVYSDGERTPAVEIEYITGGMSICLLSNVVRIPDEVAAGLWLAIQRNKRELQRIVKETLNMYADI